MKSYNVNCIEKKSLKINGKANAPQWNDAISLSDFCSPWEASQINRIAFKALWDTETFFFSFCVEDPDVYIDSTDDTINSINKSDRVELFFRTDSNLNPYYCLEIDPTPRIMDFKALPNKVFDFNWNWPVDDIEVKSSRNGNHFTVEGAISIKSLIKLGLLKNGCLETGVFRAKYNKQHNGEYEPTWITWVNPKTETPNFHIASSFGILNLENFNLS